MARRIRVVQMIYGFGVEGAGGGVGRFAIELSRALDPGRFEVSVYGLWDRGTPFEHKWIRQLNAEGIGAFIAARWDENRPYRSFWRAFRAIQSALSQRPADIVHSHHEFADVVALLLKARLKPPAIMRTVHYGYRYEWKKRPLRRLLLTNLLYPLLFNAEIGISQAIVENLNRRPLSRLLRRQALCVHNAIDLGRFSDTKTDPVGKRRSLNLPEDAPIIGTVGRLTEQKGYAFLVEAGGLVLQHWPNAYFLIVGDGELKETLMDQAQRLGIASHVIFTGPRSDIEALLHCMDIFASPSLWEGLPTVIMESMAAGVPVIGTDIPGTCDLIQHRSTGWLVPPADSRALADAILTMMGSPSLRREIACRAREAVQRFSITEVAKTYAALYQATYGDRTTRNSPTSST